MKRNSVALILSAATALLLIAGCKTTNGAQATAPTAPVQIARQACVIDALAEERDALMKTMDDADPDYGQTTTTTSEHRWTIVKDKLIAYRAEVEASYRFVTANCNSYNLCMEANNYNESACAQTRKAWEASHDKFNELAIAINNAKRPHHGHGHGHGHHGGGCSPSSCGTQGGIFSQGCCDDD